MTFSSKKYFAIFILVLVITAFCVPLMGMKDETESPIDTKPIIIEEEPEEEPVVVPKFNDCFSAYNYALDKIKNGKGYKFTCSTRATGSVAGQSGTQLIYYTATKEGNKYKEETYAVTKTFVGKTFYKETYVEGDSVKVRETTNLQNTNGSMSEVSHAFTNEEIRTMDLNTWINNESLIGTDNFCFTVNKTTAKMVSFNSMNSEFYNFEISLNVNQINPVYTANIKKNAEATNFSMQALTFNCYVSKKTGKFLQIKKKETYTITAFGLADVVTNSETMYNFLSVDKEQNLTDPFI